MSTSSTPPKRIQPGRGSKPKSLWDMCEECFLHHDPEEICVFAEDEYSEDDMAVHETAPPAKRAKKNEEEKKSDNSENDMAVQKTAPPAKKAKTNLVGDGGKKRGKIVRDEEIDICECEGMEHETEAEYEREQIRKKHVEVAFCIMLASKATVIIKVYASLQAFQVCKELLALHSGLFQRPLKEFWNYTGQLCYTLPNNVSPLQFSFFLSWMQHGYFIDPLLSISENESNIDVELEHLWVAGHQLESPGFQNYVMERLRTSDGAQAGDWPTPDEARTVYRLVSGIRPTGSRSSDGGHSMLRKFVADSIAADNPFERYDPDSDEYEEWSRLYTENSVISLDVHKASSKRWSESKPWEDQHRKKYLVEEKSIDERWEEMILEGRTAHNIAVAAGGGCIRSKLELEYLGDSDE